MDIQSKLDTIQEQRQTLLTLSPIEQLNKNLSSLYLDVVDARQNETTAPLEVKSAEKKYYETKYGPDYKNQLKLQFTGESRVLWKTMMDKQIRKLNEMNKSLAVYKSERTYLQNITDVQTSILSKIKDLLDKIRQSNTDINNRKSFYMDQEQKNLGTWIVVCNCFILSYVGVIGYQYRDQLSNVRVYGMIIILLSIVFLLPYIVNVVVKFPTSVNVYTEWGYDPTESKTPWLISIPIGLVVLYYIVVYFM
jgi:hypothetical protein